jgi:hypothetical protein
LRGLVGAVAARPWLDRLTLAALKRAYFPLSRLWAAADAAGGEAGTFWHEAGVARRHEFRDRVAARLASFEAAKASARAIDRVWEGTFFGADVASEAQRVAIETARHAAAHRFNLQRRGFVFLLGRDTPRIRLAVPTPDEVAAIYPPTTRDEDVFAAPDVMPLVERSQPVAAPFGMDAWLRFESPSQRLGDTVFARVHTPEGVDNPPTVILGHGICVEFDHWHGLIDETATLLANGIRVIRPEAPYHGRRRPEGTFAAERAIGTSPLGMIDLYAAAVQEWAVLADWARQTSSGPLAFAGTSLGALTAQLASSVAHLWPDRLRPEALYMMTHSGDMAEATVSGAIAGLFADPAAVAARGWTGERLRRQMSLVDPVQPPVMAPSRIVSVLGSEDVITPFAGGKALVERWQVPAANVFVSRRGHFTIPMSLQRDHGPTLRFVEILRAL